MINLINKNKAIIVILVLAVALVGCNNSAPTEPTPTDTNTVEINYKFNENDEGWKGEFANVPVVTVGTEYNLKFAHEDIPVPGQESKGLMLQGNNINNMIFLYTYVKLNDQDKLIKNTNYKVDLSLVLASNVPSKNSEAVDNVFVKAGVVMDMPKLNAENELNKLNLDIGQKGVDSKDFKTLGNIGKLNSDDESYQYKMLESSFDVTTTDKTNLYLLVGIEINTKIEIKAYIDDVKIKLTKK